MAVNHVAREQRAAQAREHGRHRVDLGGGEVVGVDRRARSAAGRVRVAPEPDPEEVEVRRSVKLKGPCFFDSAARRRPGAGWRPSAGEDEGKRSCSWAAPGCDRERFHRAAGGRADRQVPVGIPSGGGGVLLVDRQRAAGFAAAVNGRIHARGAFVEGDASVAAARQRRIAHLKHVAGGRRLGARRQEDEHGDPKRQRRCEPSTASSPAPGPKTAPPRALLKGFASPPLRVHLPSPIGFRLDDPVPPSFASSPPRRKRTSVGDTPIGRLGCEEGCDQGGAPKGAQPLRLSEPFAGSS